MSVRIETASSHCWPDVELAFGNAASRPDACWCQRFRRHDAQNNRDALHQEIDSASVPVGLIAYLEERPVGWTRVVPRNSLAGVTGNRALRRLLDDDEAAWWVTCVNVRREARRRGIGTSLLRAAVVHARQHGAARVEGHPVDVSKLKATPSPSAVFMGTLTMFTDAGFEEIGRTYPSRPVVRHL